MYRVVWLTQNGQDVAMDDYIEDSHLSLEDAELASMQRSRTWINNLHRPLLVNRNNVNHKRLLTGAFVSVKCFPVGFFAGELTSLATDVAEM